MPDDADGELSELPDMSWRSRQEDDRDILRQVIPAFLRHSAICEQLPDFSAFVHSANLVIHHLTIIVALSALLPFQILVYQFLELVERPHHLIPVASGLLQFLLPGLLIL